MDMGMGIKLKVKKVKGKFYNHYASLKTIIEFISFSKSHFEFQFFYNYNLIS